MSDCSSDKSCCETDTLAGQASKGEIQAAVRLEIWTIVWMVIEAAASIGAGIAASSLLLVAFGADSVIELFSAAVLYVRLSDQAKAEFQDEELWEAKERKAAKIAGVLLYALSAYVVIQGVYGLTHRHQAESSWLGMGVAVIAAVGMPLLGRAKLRIAEKIGSRALRADAMESLTCGYLSWVVLVGLVGNSVLEWWWLDSAVSLAIVPLLLREAKEAVSGEDCCEGSGN